MSLCDNEVQGESYLNLNYCRYRLVSNYSGLHLTFIYLGWVGVLRLLLGTMRFADGLEVDWT